MALSLRAHTKDRGVPGYRFWVQGLGHRVLERKSEIIVGPTFGRARAASWRIFPAAPDTFGMALAVSGRKSHDSRMPALPQGSKYTSNT